MMRTHTCGALRAKDAGQRVTLCGWVDTNRDHGGIIFLDIPTTVIVGNRDTRIDASVRQDEIINLRQGRNRLRRARCYTRALRSYAESQGKDCAPTLLTLPGMSHDFHQCVAEGGLLQIAAHALL